MLKGIPVKTIFIFLLLSTDMDMTLDATAVYGLQTLEQCNFILETIKVEFNATDGYCYDDSTGDINTKFGNS